VQPPDLQQGMPRRRTVPDLWDEETLVQIATAAFVKELGLEDSKVLEGGKVEIRDVSTGTHLMKEDSHKVQSILFLS